MIDLIQQLAILDGLLNSWEVVQAKMGPASAAQEQELAKLAMQLSAASEPGEIARALDDLLELVEDTPAYDYVRRLLARAQLPEETVRRGPSAAPLAPEDDLPLRNAVTMTGRVLGAAAVSPVETCLVPIFFATNRKEDATQPPENRFSAEDAKTITFGLAQVTIPVARHRLGRLEAPVWWNLFVDERDATRFVVLHRLGRLGTQEFCNELSRAAAQQSRTSVLIFLHGYNVTFDEAVRRAAQLAYDLRFQGPLVLFSWPSLGSTFGYLADEDRAALSAKVFVEFLRVLEGGPWEEVHLVGHSMGNRVVIFGLADNPAPALPFGQMVFVAADVYVELFEQKFPNILGIGRLKTSYASKGDRALLLSSWLHRAARIGLIRGEPYVSTGLETVDASVVDTSLLSLGHSYFGQKRSTITDLGYLLREGLPAARRGLEQLPGKKYWDFPR
ncbi:MAG: alpha/beta fold hydrolase [Acetobacteraceae bacterium]|nr:alpha/beta fold hydrolase [Acetobacteraceae bacterium]